MGGKDLEQVGWGLNQGEAEGEPKSHMVCGEAKNKKQYQQKT